MRLAGCWLLLLGAISLHWTQTKGETPSVAAIGTNPLDIIFLLDNTVDVNVTEFEVLKEFTEQVIGFSSIGGDEVRVGVITYGHSPNGTIDQIELDTHFDAVDAIAGVDAIAYDPNGVDGFLGDAIDRMVDAFAGDFGARTFAPHVGILLTKGLTSCDDQARAARRAMDANIILRIIVVTPNETQTMICARRKRNLPMCQFSVCSFINSFLPELVPKTELFSTLTDGIAAQDLVDDIRTCTYDCGLLTIGDGTVQYTNGTAVSSIATFVCNFGFALSMDVTATCTFDAGWSMAVPTCEVVECGPPPPPTFENGTRTVMGVQFGSETTFSCDSGFTLRGPDRTVCQADGTWSEVDSFCEIVDCGILGDIRDGHVVYESDPPTTFGSAVSYTCDVGYELTTPVVRTCEANGQWNGVAATCVAVDCGGLNNPANGNVSTEGGTTYKCNAVYTCNTGYILNGGKVRKCDTGGIWTDSEPTCDIVNCGEPENITNGIATVPSTTYDSTVTYSCDTGFRLVGLAERTCSADGQWTNGVPFCTEIDCDVLDGIANGHVTYTSGTTFQSQAQYECDTGYEPSTNQRRTCQYNGMWNFTAATCDPVTCSSLNNIANGAVDISSGTTYQHIAVYTCTRGYTLSGVRTRTCLADGFWSATEPTCDIVDCGSLSDIPNGLVSTPTTTYLATAQYSCMSNYALQGNTTRTCEADGNWSGREPFCEIIDCSALVSPANGYVSYVGGTALEDSAEFMCDTGYTIANMGLGDLVTNATCQTGGWSTLPTSCQIVTCPPLGSLGNGSIQLTRGNEYTSVAIHICDSGYTLGAVLKRTCQSDGTWTTPEPTCSPIECNAPADILNGNYSMDSGTTEFMATLTYQCDDGYQLIGSQTRTCRSDGHWSEAQPLCLNVIIVCDQLSSIASGYVEYSNGLAAGSVATYSCYSGYTVSVPNTRTCGADGEWSGSEAQCTIVSCPSPPAPVNGSVDTSRGTTYQSVAVYQCDLGYTLQGQAITTCQANGTWSGTTPTCAPVECGPLSNIVNGTVNTSQGRLVGDVATYTCAAGNVLRGPVVRQCRADGTWSAREPLCEVVDCDVLNSVQGAYVSYSDGTIYQSQATYAGETGYLTSGDTVRICQADGVWSGIEPSYALVDCMSPPVLTDGSVDTSRGTTYQSVAVYQCDLGYTLQGQAITACQVDGIWSGTTPTCAVVDCGVLDAIFNGTVSTPQGTVYGATASYSCDTGHRLVGNGTRECQADGRWSGDEPSCEIVNCRGLRAVTNGDIVFISSTTYGSVAEVTCHNGYELIGNASVCLASGQWTGDPPICRVKDCGPPSSVLNGSVAHTRETTYKGLAIYTCDTGFDLVGPELRSCQDNQTWSGVDPYCRIRDCGSPPSLPNGQRSYAGTTYLSTANYSCNIGYILQGPNELTCQASQQWRYGDSHYGVYHQQQQNCQIVDCGSPGDVPNGNMTFTSGTVYMSTVTVSCNPGYELLGYRQRTCQPDGTWTGSTPQCLVPTPPDNVTVSSVNTTHILLTWNYPQNVTRECDAVYRRVEVGQQDGVIQTTDLQTPVPTGPEMRVTLPFNETEALINVGEPGTYEFRIICNSTIGETDFSSPVTAEVDDGTICPQWDISCNPSLIFAATIPPAAVVAIAAIGIIVLVVVKCAPKKKPPIHPELDKSSTVIANEP